MYSLPISLSRRRPVSASPGLRVSLAASFILGLVLLALAINAPSNAQRRSRSGAHSSISRETFTAADRTIVERAIGSACAERIRDPLGSTPIDQMQARPSLSSNSPDAVAGARRAERLLPTTRKLVTNAIIQLAKEYGFYDTPAARAHINAATARVQAVKRVRANVDARDNASVLLRDPRAIEFGTIFLAGLPSDEAMISVIAHELTHVAGGQGDALRPLYRAIARRAVARTGLRIQGQRAEELACDLIGLIATSEFIRQTPSWEPPPRRIARAVEHNCVEDDSSDEDHLSPRNTIRALFALDVDLARELVLGSNAQSASPRMNPLTVRVAAF
jgi:ribosomal protein S21